MCLWVEANVLRNNTVPSPMMYFHTFWINTVDMRTKKKTDAEIATSTASNGKREMKSVHVGVVRLVFWPVAGAIVRSSRALFCGGLKM
mmetsp:Transcript_30078/g.69385  ORF Transcript_30078/g.69385 Transcript_30078/m.69385 type:complete len:88 (-) Transcript_30078:245-508(-)